MSSDTPPSAALHILVVDDHAIVREGLRRILEGAGQGWVVSEAGGGFQALEILRRSPVGLLIADMSMPGMNGLELIRRVRAEHARLPVLVLSMHAEEQYALRAFRCGANGYLTKDRAGAELVEAVTKLAAGGAYVTPSLAEQVVQGLNGTARGPAHGDLSDREFDVLRRIVGGQRLSTIAEELHLSVKTVSSHKRRILDKLGLQTTAALIHYGMEHGLEADGTTTF